MEIRSMRKRRRFVPQELYFVTCRTTKGLPFVPNFVIKSLISGIIARAQELYPGVTICHFIVMGNHYHFVVLLEASAEQMKEFFRYIDGEIPSLFNRLQGKAHRKFWSKRYDAKPIKTATDALSKIAYIYLNPVKANFIDRAEHWEGASSLEQFIEETPRYYKWISSSQVERLPCGPFTKSIEDMCHGFIEESTRAYRELKISPYAWKKIFRKTRGLSNSQLKEEILHQITEGENDYRKKRLSENKVVVGVRALRRQSIYKEYISKTYERNSLCISSCKETLKHYKGVYRAFCEECERIWQGWKQGDFSVSYPPGAFIPPIIPLASIYEGT